MNGVYSIGDVIYPHYRPTKAGIVIKTEQLPVAAHLVQYGDNYLPWFVRYTVRLKNGKLETWMGSEIKGRINELIADHQKKMSTLVALRVALETQARVRGELGTS